MHCRKDGLIPLYVQYEMKLLILQAIELKNRILGRIILVRILIGIDTALKKEG